MVNQAACISIFIGLITIPICAQEYIITTVAGPGQPSLHTFAGDGGPATSAQLNSPTDVLIDRAGSIIIADTNNGRVRKVVNGIITTIAGGGTAVGDGVQATAARLFYPMGLAMDRDGDLFISDVNRIRKVTPDGMITTVVGGGKDLIGDGVPALTVAANPTGLAMDREDNLLFADTGVNRVRRLSKDGMVRTIAGASTPGVSPYAGDGGPARSAHLNQPGGVAVDSAGNIFVADSSNNRIRKVSNDGTILTVTITAPPASRVVADSAGNIFYTDGTQLHELSSNGVTSTLISSVNAANLTDDGGLAGLSTISHGRGLAFDGNGNLYIALPDDNAVRVLHPVKPLDLKTGYWDTIQHLPMPAQMQAALDQQLAAAAQYPENQRAAYIAQIKESQKQAAKGMDIKGNVCVTSDHPLLSLLFGTSTPGPCTRHTGVTDQQLTMNSTCSSGEFKTTESLVVERIDATHFKGSTQYRTMDAGGKIAQETDKTFTANWVRASCAPNAK